MKRLLWILMIASSLLNAELSKEQRLNAFINFYFHVRDINVSPLPGGYTDAGIYIIDHNQKQYVLRLQPLTRQQDLLQSELFVMKEAAEKRVGPAIYFASPDATEILMEYIPGGTISFQEGKKTENIVKIAQAIRKTHSIPINPFPRKTHLEYLEDVFRESDPSDIYSDKVILLARKINAELKQFRVNKVTLHGDLHQGNIFIGSGEVTFVDWSETNTGDPFIDLTFLDLFLDYNDQETSILLRSYLERSPTDLEKQRYILNKKFNLAHFALILLNGAYKMSKDQGVPLNLDTPLQSWQDYIEQFETNLSKTPPQIFFDWGRCAFLRLQNS